ncbi:tight adherence pilus pseudopilin TadF [Kluyvera sichuanensis]|uniref:tight adherence pilus pseudopilin TadF n=1 Tax=Kluyvera sichuanensis TaxID=2725494 RepID=UPI0034A53D4C
MKNFISSEKGASAIEFAMYIFVFTMLCGFIMDMSFSIVKKNNLERLNNSLFSILRERSTFFDGAANLSRNDLTTLKSVADRFLMKSDGSVEPYQLNIRQITFAANSTAAIQRATATSFKTDNIRGCAIDNNLLPIANLSALSVWGLPPTTLNIATPSWYPVYEVTLCIPGAISYFHRAIGLFNKDLDSLYIRDAGLPRL